MDVPATTLIAFNRPEATRRTFEAIRRVAPRQLFLLCDGPRATHPEDDVLCRQVRAILEDVDWECDVHRNYRDENLGCQAAVELGLDEVFEHVPESIIFEDDCVADPSFFFYCAEMLQRYRDDAEICHVAGFALDIPPELFNGASYAITGAAAAWGWATWADRWQAHRRRYPRQWGRGPASPCPADGTLVIPTDLWEHAALSSGLRWSLAELARSAARDPIPWDALLALSLGSIGAAAVVPAVNLVENVGFGAGATHTTAEKDLPRAQSLPVPLVHPTRSLNRAVQREVEFDMLWVPVGPRIRSIRQRVRVGGLRTTLLRFLTSYPVIRARALAWETAVWLVGRVRKKQVTQAAGDVARPQSAA
jgi:hypothetical protein